MKKYLKEQKGITLIALIITIIILLILAMVSINLVMNDGIITKAEYATEQYKVAQEKEQIQLGYTAYKMSALGTKNPELVVEGAKSTIGDGISGWRVEFESGNSYDLSPEGEISVAAPYVPVINPNQTEWTIAYAYDGTNWTKYTEADKAEGGTAEGGIVEGQIVARFCQQNVPIEEGVVNFGSGDITIPAKDYSYKLYIEGSEMPIMFDLSGATGYGYDEGLVTAMQTGNGESLLIPYVTEVFVCEGLTNIGGFAFAGGINLEKVQIAKTVQEIDSYAFAFCEKLAELTIPYGVIEIKDYAFQYAGLTKVTIPNSVTSIGEFAFQFNPLTSLTIPSSVTTLGIRAFSECELSNIILKHGIVEIGDAAFAENKITEITIPSSVTKIGGAAFFKCENLEKVYIESKSSEFSVGTQAFYGYTPTFYVRNKDIGDKITVIMDTGSTVSTNYNW